MGESAAVKRLCDLLNTFVGGWSECALSDMPLGRLSQQPLAGFPAMYSPISIVPHFVWQKRAAALMASDSCIPSQWGQMHARSVYLCHGRKQALTDCLKKHIEENE